MIYGSGVIQKRAILWFKMVFLLPELLKVRNVSGGSRNFTAVDAS